MPPPAKKRKLAEKPSVHLPSFAPQALRVLDKISKPHSDRGNVRKDLHSRPKDVNSNSVSISLGKRGIGSLQEDIVKHTSAQSCSQDNEHNEQQQSGSSHETRSPLLCRPLFSSRFSTPKRKGIQRSNIETPTKGARSGLESLALAAISPSNISSPPLPQSPATALSSPLHVQSADLPHVLNEHPALPDELQDLMALHSAFLTVLSIHCAHSGSLTPADLRILKPNVERAWRKRKVSTNDVRRILAIPHPLELNSKDGDLPSYKSPIFLSDYGHGKICIEIEVTSPHHSMKRQLINEEALNDLFAYNLQKKWEIFKFANAESTSASPTAFISKLPLFPITVCASKTKISPLLAKGQRRLDDLKAGAIKAQGLTAKPLAPSSSESRNSPQTTTATARSDDLLSRILAKQQRQSTLIPPPSPEVRHLKSALQRLEEIVPVLDILITSASRTASLKLSDPSRSDEMESLTPQGTCSFTMATLVQHMQMSLRNPISKEDAARCVRLLAAEVAPGWVSVREVGRLVGVTIRRGGLGREKILQRVKELLGKI